ncbi:hypothetical protein RHMOL_Rhmol11G0008200 [Rhododendron molle]|uniref:Uncharacterized protein n=1 Tax=Rhododendron molle TaxID=49168 RepID=A0ACC0LNH3_RHOML|nr:hypothetical protein RHMOL_Rhmol11G0008200 [Rhododendron molle]
MVISDKWNCYKEDDVVKANLVRTKLLDDVWWSLIDYILSFTAPIYDMLRACDTDKACLQLVCDMWDSMIEMVKLAIYKHEGKRLEQECSFYNVVYQILADRWTKNNTPLHCLAHSLNPKYHMDPYTWWCAYGAFAPALQKVALRILGQPASSSCCERNWSTYSFVHSVKRNKMTPPRAEDLVFVHSNLRLLSRKTPQYSQGQTKMWDIAGDAFDSLADVGILEVAELSLDEPELEAVVCTDDGDDANGVEGIVEVED